MRVAALRRWHWITIGLLGGFLCGEPRDTMMNFSDELEAYGRRIGQRDFERALEARYAGRPGFTDLVVYPYHLSGSSAGSVEVRVVSGLYCDGHAEELNGRLALRYRPAYFVASVPFRPVGAGENVMKGAAGNAFDDVTKYLSQKRASGVTFRNASWWWMTRPVFVWTAGGFLLVGLVWPAVVNLLVFGRFTRPRESKAVKLAALPRVVAAPAVAVDMEAVEQLDRELEAVVGTVVEAGADGPNSPTSQPRELETQAVEALATVDGPAKEFGTKREDFYPTELGAKHAT